MAKLPDFGLVQELSADTDFRLTRTGTVLGAPAYMSPEQTAGEPAVDTRGDLYGLGSVAFFALTGQAGDGEHGKSTYATHSAGAIRHSERLKISQLVKYLLPKPPLPPITSTLPSGSNAAR